MENTVYAGNLMAQSLADRIGRFPVTKEEQYRTWLESRRQPKPKYMKSIKERDDYRAYYLKPEDMTAFLNATTPYDLYKNPNYTPIQADYPSVGFNIKDKFGLPRSDKEKFTVLSTEDAPYYGLKSMYSVAKEHPEELPRQYTPQAVYEHEFGHYQDPRLDPEALWSFPNKGFLRLEGRETATPLWQREFPAQLTEDRYWRNLLDKISKRKIKKGE